MASKDQTVTARKILTGETGVPEIPLRNAIAWIQSRADPIRAEGQDLMEKLRAHEEAAAKIRQRLTEIRGVIQNYERDINDILASSKEIETEEGENP